MKHAHRFYVHSIGDEENVRIDGEQAHHILNVFRLKAGDEIVLFDGSGVECRGVIEKVQRSALDARIISRETVDREPQILVTLALSIPKSKKMNLVVQKCAELGLKTLIPIYTDRTVVRVKEKASAKTQKWQRIAEESSKQSGRNMVLEIAKPQKFSQVIAGNKDYDVRLLASTCGENLSLSAALGKHPDAKRIIYIIGPEGGFTDEELKLAESSGWQFVSLGKSILRVETAAIAAIAMILYEYS